MGVCGIDTGAGLSFSEELDTNDSVPRLVIICVILHGS